jgi:hypothetical protein
MTAAAADTTLVWGAPQWLGAAAAFAGALLALLAWGYWRAGAGPGVRALAIGLKVLAVLLLAACLLEPLFSGRRARPGANQFVVLADDSKSMSLHDGGDARSRGERVRAIGESSSSPWLDRLAQDFDLRQYAFDTQLRALANLGELTLSGGGSNLGASLDRLARRYQGRPLAGILLFTDGNATDPDAVERLLARAKGATASAGDDGGGAASAAGPWLPPVYVVSEGGGGAAPRDVNLESVTVTQTNFEDAPVTLAAHVTTTGGYGGRTLVAEVLDESGKSVERQTPTVERDGQPLTLRFRLRPEQPGVSFYRVRITPQGDVPVPPAPSTAPSTTAPTSVPAPVGMAEATLANNSRLVAVDRGQGPYRVLYVAGRPNWEFKFLQRALVADGQVELVGMIRLANREPKFNFIGRRGEEANPLFRGFDNADPNQVEQYDQPVIVRFNAKDGAELRGGFPKAADELFAYHAVILDDVEAAFFTQDQMQLLNDFVRHRGGGLLMLGGQESFRNGRFERTPIGDMLPVYADGGGEADAADAGGAGSGDETAATFDGPSDGDGPRYRLALTREGWLEPWVRLRADEDAERKRVEAMPGFQTLNRVRGIKPGATVLARVTAEGADEPVPALVEQRFGAGRVGALLIGDLWRWGLRRPEAGDDDLPKAWRQTVRWLVADVPKRVDVTLAQAGAGAADSEGSGAAGGVTVRVRVRDAAYAPLDNAAATVRVTAPDGTSLDLTADPAASEPGAYEATYVPRQPGAYRAEVTAAAADGSEVGRAQAGWTSDPAAEEFRKLAPNVALLERLARETGGQVVDPDDLASFVASLPTRHAEITEPYVQPAWHQPWVFLLAIACLAGEWGLRRWKGLP